MNEPKTKRTTDNTNIVGNGGVPVQVFAEGDVLNKLKLHDVIPKPSSVGLDWCLVAGNK